MLAINVNIQQFIFLIWRTTKRFTPGKSLTDARPASFLPQPNKSWKATLQENIWRKSHISVTNATSFLLLLMNCSFTWGHTQAKDLLSATNALRHIQGSSASHFIPKAIKMRSKRLLHNQARDRFEKKQKRIMCPLLNLSLIFSVKKTWNTKNVHFLCLKWHK